MDRKDLELLIRLFEFGRVDPSALAPLLSITEVNVHRRIVLLQKEGIVSGFSAFFDRRSFGYDTTYLRIHYPAKRRNLVLDEISGLKWVPSIYPNMDDFAIIETVHRDTATLKNHVKRIEETCTVSAAYSPRLPDMVPDLDPKEDIPLLRMLVKNGYATYKDLSRSLNIDADSVMDRMRTLQDSGSMRILPLLCEEEVHPFPCFSFLISFEDQDAIPQAMGLLRKIAPLLFYIMPLERPPGLWLRTFGHDLHAMDHMLERLRRLDSVSDLTVILPDRVSYKREVDIRLLDRT